MPPLPGNKALLRGCQPSALLLGGVAFGPLNSHEKRKLIWLVAIAELGNDCSFSGKLVNQCLTGHLSTCKPCGFSAGLSCSWGSLDNKYLKRMAENSEDPNRPANGPLASSLERVVGLWISGDAWKKRKKIFTISSGAGFWTINRMSYELASSFLWPMRICMLMPESQLEISLTKGTDIITSSTPFAPKGTSNKW